MELYYFGEEESCRLQLCNGFTVMIDYGGSDKDFDSSKNNYNAIYRRVRLYDDKGELVAEMVEENPFKKDVKFNINSKDPDLLL